MAALTDEQIANVAKATGLNNSQTAIAVAIALAESGGDSMAHNGVPPDNSYGLWQINMIGALGPSRRQQFGIGSNEELFNPVTNAKAMHYLSNGGQNWRPWTTYTRGTYLRFLARGQKVSGASGDVSGITTTPAGLTNSLSSILAVSTILQSPKFWIRVGIVFVGVGIAFYGILKLTNVDNQLSQIAKSAIDFVPGGGVVKKVMKGVK